MIHARTIGWQSVGLCQFAVGPFEGPFEGPQEAAWRAFVWGPVREEQCECGATVVYLRKWQRGRRPMWLVGDWGRYERQPMDRQWHIVKPERREHRCLTKK